LELANIKIDNKNFYQYYGLDPLNIQPNAPQYSLPLTENTITNYGDAKSKLSLDENDLSLLKKNGFVVIKNPFNQKEENIVTPYETIKNYDMPVFITTDSLLHIYHIQFDETLRQIEEREFYDNIWSISKVPFQETSIEEYNSFDGDLKEASKRNVVFFSVAFDTSLT